MVPGHPAGWGGGGGATAAGRGALWDGMVCPPPQPSTHPSPIPGDRSCRGWRGSLPSVLADTPVLAVALQLAQATGKVTTASSLPSTPPPPVASPLSPPSPPLPSPAPPGGQQDHEGVHPILSSLLPALCLNPLPWAWR